MGVSCQWCHRDNLHLCGQQLPCVQMVPQTCMGSSTGASAGAGGAAAAAVLAPAAPFISKAGVVMLALLLCSLLLQPVLVPQCLGAFVMVLQLHDAGRSNAGDGHAVTIPRAFNTIREVYVQMHWRVYARRVAPLPWSRQLHRDNH